MQALKSVIVGLFSHHNMTELKLNSNNQTGKLYQVTWMKLHWKTVSLGFWVHYVKMEDVYSLSIVINLF